MHGGVAGSFLRQLSGKEAWEYGAGGGSRRWSGGRKRGWAERSPKQMEGMCHGVGGAAAGMVIKKRVVVVIDHTARAKHAMMWALTHVANKGDIITLLHVVAPHCGGGGGAGGRRDARSGAPLLADSLGTLCKACKPEVEVEALVIQGPKLPTVLSQVKKLEASVLVLSQSKPSPFCCLFGAGEEEDFVEHCINKSDCLTLAVRKQSGGVGGYLVSSRWQKNFWLLA